MSEQQNVEESPATYPTGGDPVRRIDLTVQPLNRLLDWFEHDVTSTDDYRRLTRGKDPSPVITRELEINAERLRALRQEITRRVEGAS